MKRALYSALAALPALLAIAAMTTLYLQQAIDPMLFFNSDAQYLPALYADLVEQGGRLRQWYLTPAPYFLPDWPLYFAARWLSGDAFHAWALVMAAQALALWGLAALLARRYVALPQA
ncbi:hypothetical protein, partial [Duganella callida]